MDRKTTKPILLVNILQDFFNKHLEQSDQGFAIKLWKKWHLFNFSKIITKTKPLSYQNGRLVLWVANSVELQELNFHKEELKQNINSYFKKTWIKEIFFTTNTDLLKKREQSINFFINKIKK